MFTQRLGPLATLCLLVSPVLAADDPPPVFRELSFGAALELGTAEGRLVLLDAMTSWCGPCKQMDRTTWIDPRLVSWIDQHGVAIQLDMDEHVELKEFLGIAAFPTIVLFRDAQEIDRVVGSRSAEQMLAWLGGNLEGRTSKDVLLERLAELRAVQDPASTWDARASMLQDLAFLDLPQETQTEVLWLWQNLPDEGGPLRQRRLSMRWGALCFEMRDLAGRRPGARAAFAGLRDALATPVRSGTASQEQLRDWIELNAVLGEDRATADWADLQALTEPGVARLRGLGLRLFQLLLQHDRWPSAGLCLNEPVAWATWMRDSLGVYDEPPPAAEAGAGGSGELVPAIPMIPMVAGAPQGSAVPAISMGASADPRGESPSLREILTEQFRTETAQRYGALLAAGRDAEAEAIAEILLGEADDARARAVLVAAALRARSIESARERHLRWLDEAAR